MSGSRIYPAAFSKFVSGDLVWTSLTPRAILLSPSFTYSAGLQYRDQLDESFVIAESDVLATLTFSNNVAGGLPFQWLQLLDNRLASHIVLFDDTGDDAYSELLVYYDDECLEGLPAVLAGEDYFLYPVTPPGGFFTLDNLGDTVGPVNSYSLAYNLALGESVDGVTFSLPCLVFGRNLVVSQRICFLPDELDTDQCCKPTIRSSLCE